MPHHIAFVTSEKYADLTPDDRLAASELERAGDRVTPVVWSEETIPWTEFDIVVLRSTWDYHLRAGEFRAWLDTLEAAHVPLWNPVGVARWNMEKTYLRDLEARGVRIVPTAWATGEGELELQDLLDMLGWTDAVVKPAIAATAFETFRAARGDEQEAQDRFAALCRRGTVLVQQYRAEIETRGEWSVVFLGGDYSHATLKRPAPGDFRVQNEFGGGWVAAEPPAEVRATAANIIAHVESPLLYTRVDGISTDEGFMLMELELLEPHLFLADHSSAPGRFADAIRSAMNARSPSPAETPRSAGPQ